MKLGEIFEGLDEKIKNDDIRGIAFDVNEVKDGYIFFALRGKNFDGHDFVFEAKERGASASVVERKVDCDINQIQVENTRKALSLACKRFYGNAVDKLTVCAVTGTNGKTTTAYMLNEILIRNGRKTCLIGTNGVVVNGKHVDSNLTTPDPTFLHKIFAMAVEEEVTHVVMEASAHALYLHKLYGINFNVGAFTNFSRDHLDYFENMDEYGKAKHTLIDQSENFVANGDDEFCKTIYDSIKFGFNENADFKACNVSLAPTGSVFSITHNGHRYRAFCPLIGRFNIYNCLCAVAMAKTLGISIENSLDAISKMREVDGRVNVIHAGKGDVIIDFAHTPDGLEKVLSCAKELCRNKLTVVFGCGGNRDKGKRYEMGKISARLCDKVVVTLDNPRDEEPYEIIGSILRGIKESGYVNYYVIPDRASAIENAITTMDEGDIAVIAGKGAEKYQEVKGVKRPFSDYECASEVIRRRDDN